MTQDEIIEMAIQSGLLAKRGTLGRCSESNFEAFAKLVAEKAVRESSAEYRLGWNDGQILEREACAKVCGRLADEALVVGDEDAVMCFEEAEDAIRARGEA